MGKAGQKKPTAPGMPGRLTARQECGRTAKDFFPFSLPLSSKLALSFLFLFSVSVSGDFCLLSDSLSPGVSLGVLGPPWPRGRTPPPLSCPPGCRETCPRWEQRLQQPVGCDRGRRLLSRARFPTHRSLRTLLAEAEDPAPSIPALSLVVPSQAHCCSAPPTPPAPDARAGLQRGGRDRAGTTKPQGRLARQEQGPRRGTSTQHCQGDFSKDGRGN